VAALNSVVRSQPLNERLQHRGTIPAILVAVVILVPATAIGAWMAILVQWLLNLILKVPNWLDLAPWLKDILLVWIPNFGGGVICGLISILVALAIFSSANLKVVSLSVAILFSVTAALGGILIVTGQVEIPLWPYAAQCMGIVVGLVVARWLRPNNVGGGP